MMASLHNALRSACGEVGILFRDVPADGRWHTTDVDGDRAGKGDGRIKLFPDGEGGIVTNWKGDTRAFFANDGGTLNAQERAEVVRKRREAIRRNQEEAARRRAEAANKAADIWAQAIDASPDFAYLMQKGIKPHGAKADHGSLVVPMRKGGELRSLQFIRGNGEKRFLPDGEVTGCNFPIGTATGASALCIAEGFATGASIHEATGLPVAVAFNAGNLQPVARALRAKFPELPLILCADDDYRTEGNPGLAKATEAARAVGGLLAVPDFGSDRPDGATDFNDLAKLRGAEAVQQAIEGAQALPTIAVGVEGENVPRSDSDGWLQPQRLSAKVEPEPYPLDALPVGVREAVKEVADFTKAPVALVASSALAALSLACQAHVDVKRDEKLRGPVSLDLLTIADSGERKSTCDGFFVAAIRQYQEEQTESMRPEIEKRRAELAAWEAERDGLLAAIKEASRKSRETDKLRAKLAELQREKPEPPRVPRLLLGDETPENLAWSLAKLWPSSGVISSEAGLILGAHGMGKDSVMRNLSLLNVLWDGGTHSVGRRTSECFTVKGARLTVALQVQEAVLRSFFDRSGELARGTGFLSRFLIAWPESTQGTRFYCEAPKGWPKLGAFHRRIAEILEEPAPLADDGSLSPTLLALAEDAKAAWVEYHNAIERELSSGGELYDVRDVASKSADNAVRLAALFQMFDRGIGDIELNAFQGASRIARWHLNESRRFFGELALPAEFADAARLDRWLIDYCRRNRTHMVATRDAQRLGPVRDKQRLDRALGVLEELDRARVAYEGRRRTIRMNPRLLEFATATLATLATDEGTRGRSVATVATVSVAGPENARPATREVF